LSRARAVFKSIAAVLAACVLALASSDARAQTSSNSGSGPPSTGLELLQKQPYWALGAPRWFAAATIETGFIYLREELALGWGKPHYAWGGLDLSTSVSASAITERAGLRLSVPHLELRGGARYVIPFSHYFLRPQDSYYRDDVDLVTGDKSRYLALDAEATLSAKAWVGSLFAVGGAYALLGAPSGKYLFDESFHAVVAPPTLLRARAGYLLQLGLDGEIGVGAFGEVIDTPIRGVAIGRAGPIVAVQVSDHLDIQASVAFVVASHDDLGLRGGDISQLGVRYRWATGEPAPWIPLR
jgi:hypothetical protein